MIVTGVAATAGAEETELAVHIKVIDGVVLIGRVPKPSFYGMAPFGPGQRVRPSVGVIDQIGGALHAEPDQLTAIEVQIGRTGRIIWSKTYAQRIVWAGWRPVPTEAR